MPHLEGLGPLVACDTKTPDNPVQAIADTTWQPEYDWGQQK
jgi:hypothetical protein